MIHHCVFSISRRLKPNQQYYQCTKPTKPHEILIECNKNVEMSIYFKHSPCWGREFVSLPRLLRLPPPLFKLFIGGWRPSSVELYTLKTPRSAWPGKGSIGAKLHSGSPMTRKSVNLTRNMTQSWVNLTPLFVSLTDFRVFLECSTGPVWCLKYFDQAQIHILSIKIHLLLLLFERVVIIPPPPPLL